MAKVDELYKLTVEIGAKVDGLKSGLNKGKRELNLFGGQAKRIGALIAGAFTISKLSQFTLETIKLAGEAQGVEYAFKRIGNLAALENLRKATRGTVSNLELMRKSVQASNLGVDVNKLGVLFEFAARRAQETGESVDYLVNSITLGIGRRSIMILDNLGLTSDRIREKLHGVGFAASSSLEATAAVAEIAAEELKKMGEPILTAKDRFEQLHANVQNLRIELGENLLPAAEAVLEVINQLFADSPIRKAGDATEKLVNNLKKLPAENRIAALNTSLFKTTMQLADLMVEKQIIEKQPIFQRDFQRLNEVNKQMRGIRMYLEQFGTFTDAGLFVKDEERINSFLKTLSGEGGIPKSIGLIESLIAEITLLDEAIKKEPDLSKLKKLEKQYKDLEKQLTDLYNAYLKVASAPANPRGASEDYFSAKNAEELNQQKKDQLEIETRLYKSRKDNAEYELENSRELATRMGININQAKDYGLVYEQLNVLMNSLWSNAIEGVDNYKDAFLGAIRKTIAALIAEGVATVVGKALKSVPFPYNLIVAAGAGAAAAGLFNAVVPKFSTGGIAPGNAQGDKTLIGVNGGEMILNNNQQASLFKMLQGGMIGQNLRISGTFRQRGRDLVAVINEENKYANQIY